MLSITDDEELHRNERLLNLKELDLEIKQRELDLALHLKDLEKRESALIARKNAIAAELTHELARELERVRTHETSIIARHDVLECLMEKREKALAKRELTLSEREWTLRANEDEPKGVMAKVFSALETDSPRLSSFRAPSGAQCDTEASTFEEGTRVVETGMRVNSKLSGVDFRRVTNSNSGLETHRKDKDLNDFKSRADDLRGHLSVIRLNADLNQVTVLVDEAVRNVVELHARNGQRTVERETFLKRQESQIGASAECLPSEFSDSMPLDTNCQPIASDDHHDYREINSNLNSINNMILSADPVIRALQLEAHSEKLKVTIRDFEMGRNVQDIH